MSQFSLPRSPVPARVLLDQGVSRPGDVFVMERVPHHDGAETVLEMLNRRGRGLALPPPAEEGIPALAAGQTGSVLVGRRREGGAAPGRPRVPAAGVSGGGVGG